VHNGQTTLCELTSAREELVLNYLDELCLGDGGLKQQLTRLKVIDGVHGLEHDTCEHLNSIEPTLLRCIEEEVPDVFGLLYLYGKAKLEVALQIANGLTMQVLQPGHVAGIFNIEEVDPQEVVNLVEALVVEAMPVNG